RNSSSPSGWLPVFFSAYSASIRMRGSGAGTNCTRNCCLSMVYRGPSGATHPAVPRAAIAESAAYARRDWTRARKAFDCIGEKSEAKATRDSLQPPELPAAQLVALREDSKCEGIPDSEKCGRFESERRYLRRPRTRLKSVPE